MTFAERFLRVLPPVEVTGRRIKSYHVNVSDAAIDPAIERAAHQRLPDLLPEGDGAPAAGFIVLHQGSNGSFLNVYSWVWDNVLEYHALAAGVPEIGCPDQDRAHFVDLGKPWIGCVWELAVLEHERGAWVRHMFQLEHPSLAGYLSDTLTEGTIGNPLPVRPTAVRAGKQSYTAG